MEKLFNIKMRALNYDSESRKNRHISGAERITKRDSVCETVDKMIYRALNHDRGQADSINITIEALDKSDIDYISCLDVYNVNSLSVTDSYKNVLSLLEQMDIEKYKGISIIRMLKNISNMRGAVLLDVSTMERLEPDSERGIRATKFDWNENLKLELSQRLEAHNMDNDHVREALALASKVVYKKSILGELCISDDPDYTTGYVSLRGKGYFRIKNFKQRGCDNGGRIILFDGRVGRAEEYIDFLQNTVTVINTLPNIN